MDYLICQRDYFGGSGLPFASIRVLRLIGVPDEVRDLRLGPDFAAARPRGVIPCSTPLSSRSCASAFSLLVCLL